MKRIRLLATMLACLLGAGSAHAITYELVTIGNPGNADDDTGFGGVDYVYAIGKYEVSIEEFTAFLNAVAATDTYALWNGSMGGIPSVAGISRAGSSGSYTYSVIENDGSSANRPVTSVSWFTAARFANWMSNGQPTGLQDESTTEDGAYTLDGATKGFAAERNDVNPNTDEPPTFYIPLEDEWYKAAYYSPERSGGAGGYYDFATQSDEVPGNLVSGNPNQANYLSEETGYSVSQSPNFSTTQNYLTDGGAFTASPSFYETFDQNGNIWEWNDLDGRPAPSRGLRGGAYTSTPPYLKSSYRMGYVTSGFNPNGGFRLASPAP